VQQRFGDSRPKQYCAFVGQHSMLEHTLDRAEQLSDDRFVTIIGKSHRRWAAEQVRGRGAALVEQPLNRDTGPGLYLALAYVRAMDPDAIVYILPSDHYIRPTDRFVAAVKHAGDLATRCRDLIALAGVVPEGPETEYGYIEPGFRLGVNLTRVRRFVEKPSVDDAKAAITRGALWNTFVMAASVEALWSAGVQAIPDVMSRFASLVPRIGTPAEAATLAAIYRDMPMANFSRDVLERATDRCLLVRLDGVEWSDWGHADRIEATLAQRSVATQLAV